MGCLVISIALAAFMRYLLPNFSDNSLVFVVCTGFVFGVFWDARARVGLGMMDKAPPIVLSRPVEALSLWFFGIVYGSILFGIFSSEAMTIFAIALSVVAVAGWHMYNSQQRAFGYYVYAASLMIAGFSSLLFFAAMLLNKSIW